MVDPSMYQARFRQRRLWYQKNFIEKRIRSSNGCTLRLAFQRQREPRAIAVFVTGRTEFIEKYLELAKDLESRNISLCLYDHCGQGGSGRLLVDPEKGHIDKFINYSKDLGLIVDSVAEANKSIPIYLISHSMGGAVSTLFCLENQNRVAKLILSSPMFAIRTGVFLPQIIIEKIVSATCWLGLGERYVSTTGPYQAVQPFKNNVLTYDEDRFLYNLYLSNKLEYCRFGGPTFHWLDEAFKTLRTIKQGLERVNCPILAFAGSQEKVVDLRTIKRFAGQSENCSLTEYKNGRHELFMEKDQIRNDVISRIKEFLDYS